MRLEDDSKHHRLPKKGKRGLTHSHPLLPLDCVSEKLQPKSEVFGSFLA